MPVDCERPKKGAGRVAFAPERKDLRQRKARDTRHFAPRGKFPVQRQQLKRHEGTSCQAVAVLSVRSECVVGVPNGLSCASQSSKKRSVKHRVDRSRSRRASVLACPERP